jgi:hypothetical protein
VTFGIPPQATIADVIEASCFVPRDHQSLLKN